MSDGFPPAHHDRHHQQSDRTVKNAEESIGSIRDCQAEDGLDDSVFDDLMSLDGGGDLSSPYSSLIHGDDTLSPVRTSGISPSFSWRLTNPVHMELQENAKLPTFNLFVDRSGSAINQYNGQYHPSGHASTRHPPPLINLAHSELQQQQQQEARQQPTTPTTPRLAEKFLCSSHRRGYHASYEQAGVLKHPAVVEPTASLSLSNHPTATNEKEKDSASQVTGQQDASMNNGVAFESSSILAAEVDPTPLSEIKRKHDLTIDSSSTLSTPVLIRPYSHYPFYGGASRRLHPLPIPTTAAAVTVGATTSTDKKEINEEAVAMTDALASAVATAAAIVTQQQQSSVTTLPETCTVATVTAETYTTAQQEEKKLSSHQPTISFALESFESGSNVLRQQYPHHQNHQYRRNSDSAPPTEMATEDMARRTLPSESITRASQQQAQYGFGKKHVVPSVPTPPQRNATVATVHAFRAKAGNAKKYGEPPARNKSSKMSKTRNVPNDLSSSSSPATSPSQGADANNDNQNGNSCQLHSGAAYERKKQRAKDSRVKLNESIERMSIAIHLAGAQSQERLTRWDNLLSEASDKTANYEKSTTHDHNHHYLQAGLKSIQDCLQIAESAKKWDRPSFVGSAASLIHALNAQCEAFMGEILRLQHQQGTNGMLYDQALVKHTKQDQVQRSADIRSGPDLSRSSSSSSLFEKKTTENVLNNCCKSTTALGQSEKRPLEVNLNGNCFEMANVSTVLPPVAGNKRQRGNHFENGLVKTNDMSSIGTKNEHTSSIGVKESDLAHSDIIKVDSLKSSNNGYVRMSSLLSSQAVSVATPESIFTLDNVLKRIAAFLDAVSLARCTQVTKKWKRFERDKSWHDRALQRFGHYNLRQWEGKLEDEDGLIKYSPMNLYKYMDLANVMPPYAHDGMFLMGEARLPGKVSAWTFLVERSNGETLRTVRRSPLSAVTKSGIYTSLPIVELRTIVQNTGIYDQPLVLRNQIMSVDASTRRRGEEFKEVNWDDRFQTKILHLDDTERLPVHSSSTDISPILCRLKLFEAAVIKTFLHAQGCSTMSKFVQRSNFTKVLVQIQNGTTVPLVISFPRDASHHLEH